jgi:hypothetical protein
VFKFYLVILEIFDFDKANELLKDFNSFFKKFNFILTDEDKKSNQDYRSCLIDVSLTYNQDKKSIFYDRCVDNDIKKTYFKDFKKINNSQYLEIVIANFNLISKMFPYNYKEVYRQIDSLSVFEVKDYKIKLKNRETDIKDELYRIEKQYKDYHRLSNNKLFSLYIKN